LKVIYDGDPLKDHTLASFLDKFLQKKPRSHAKGSSLMQPLASATAASAQGKKPQQTLGELFEMVQGCLIAIASLHTA
jgi:acyl transferase domain-containing protein